MMISIITVVFNRVGTISSAIDSVQLQSYPFLEHVIIDGGSTDGTIEVIKRKINKDTIFVSESDEGIYDAINKGICLSSGEILGLLHSDDYFIDKHVITEIINAFKDPEIDAVYGDLEYISRDNPSKVIRYWRAGPFSKNKLKMGWMPPHPTLFLRRRVFDRDGVYDLRYRISSDYDAILRYFGSEKMRAIYIPRVLIRMRLGGVSNASVSHIFLKIREDYLILTRNGVGGILTLFQKNISKLIQFILRDNSY
jgi:glycosyltransferase